MKIDLNGIPFDHYQRYATAASLVLTLGEGTQVLEIGANRQRLLGAFLPRSTLLYTDVMPQADAPDFVVADACDLPFADQAYQAVVSLDVLEHIPPDNRRVAVDEMARVAGRVLVIGCPIDRPWVHAAEHDAHVIWRRYFDNPYPWLEEHEEFGLVDPAQVEAALAESGMTVVRFGHGDTRLWSALMGMHFVKEAVPELSGVTASADRYYNAALFSGDRAAESYREFFVGVRHSADLDALRSAAVLNGVLDSQGVALLTSLSERLLPVADRIRQAEREWRKTSEILAETEIRLNEQALSRHQSVLDAQHAARDAINQIEYVKQQWKQTADRLRESESRLQTASVEADARLTYAQEQWKQTATRFEDAERRLQQEAAAHHETGLKLRDVCERAAALESSLDGLRTELEGSRIQSSEQGVQLKAARLESSQLQAQLEAARLESHGREADIEAAQLELNDLRIHLEAARQSIQEMKAAGDLAERGYSEHLLRLSARVIGLERRQRLVLIAATSLSVVGLAVVLVLKGI